MRHLLSDGWRVRAVTRSPGSDQARTLIRRGAEIVSADMADLDAVRRACAGAYGVYSVQNPMIAGEEVEVGEDRPLPWLSAEDVGAIAARVFGDPATYADADLGLAADVRTLAQCREVSRALRSSVT